MEPTDEQIQEIAEHAHERTTVTHAGYLRWVTKQAIARWESIRPKDDEIESLKAELAALKATIPAPTAEELERVEFEEWGQSGNPLDMRRSVFGEYMDQSTETAWQAWKAARASKGGGE